MYWEHHGVRWVSKRFLFWFHVELTKTAWSDIIIGETRGATGTKTGPPEAMYRLGQYTQRPPTHT